MDTADSQPGALARGLEGVTTPLSGVLAGREAVSLFRSDAQLETLCRLYAQASGNPNFLTTTIFDFRGEASLSWYLTECGDAGSAGAGGVSGDQREAGGDHPLAGVDPETVPLLQRGISSSTRLSPWLRRFGCGKPRLLVSPGTGCYKLAPQIGSFAGTFRRTSRNRPRRPADEPSHRPRQGDFVRQTRPFECHLPSLRGRGGGKGPDRRRDGRPMPGAGGGRVSSSGCRAARRCRSSTRWSTRRSSSSSCATSRAPPTWRTATPVRPARSGVVLVTSGPGATNTVTGLLTALMDSVPMIVLTGQTITPMLGKDAFQEADVTGITYPVVKHSYLVKNANDIPRVMQEAFYIATTGRPGPVLIDLPKDVTSAKCTAPVRRRGRPARLHRARPPRGRRPEEDGGAAGQEQAAGALRRPRLGDLRRRARPSTSLPRSCRRRW